MKKLTHSLLGFIACALLLGSCNPMDFPSRLTAVLLNEHSLSVDGGSSFSLYITATPKRYTSGDITVTWESSKPQVVTVSETGNLEALKAGFATIKVTVVSKDVTLKDSCEVMITSGDIYFADPAFEAFCVSEFDANDDGAVSTDEAAGVQRINCPELNIASLEGIEFFPSLTNLLCQENNISSLNLSYNPNLVYLNCSENAISSLDLSYNPNLDYITCNDNDLVSLNLEGNSKLEFLSCRNNELTSLDVSSCGLLEYLMCIENNISSIDLTHNPVLAYMSCQNCNMTSLDISKNTALLYLTCGYNPLTQLDLSNNTKLEFLFCRSNSLTALDLSNNTVISEVNCRDNSLTTLDVSNNLVLRKLDCSENPALAELWIKTGYFMNLTKDYATEIKYK